MTLGEKLRSEREARGVGLKEVAAATKIGSRHLEALEHDDFDSLPGDVFTKGYVRAYAEFIGSDADALVRDFVRQRGVPTAEGEQTDVAVVQEMSRLLASKAPRAGRRGPGGLFLVSAALVAVALAAWWLVGFLRSPETDPGAQRPVADARLGAPAGGEPAAELVVEPKAEVPVEREAVKPTPVVEQAPPPPVEVAEQPPVERPAEAAVERDAATPASDVEHTPPPPAEVAADPPAEPPVEVPGERIPPPPAPQAVTSPMVVSEYGVGSAVVDHRLVGESSQFEEGSQVWFWTRVLRGRPGEIVRHVWIHEGREVFSIDLRIGSGNWRTQSRKQLPPGAVGGWAVEARDAAGRMLARQAFVCTRPQRG